MASFVDDGDEAGNSSPPLVYTSRFTERQQPATFPKEEMLISFFFGSCPCP